MALIPYRNRYKGRDNIRQTSELLNTFNWEITIVNKAPGVFYPGDQLFKGQVKSVSGLPTYSHSIATTDAPAGYIVNSTGEVDHNNAAPTINFIDYEDQTIFYMFKDWMDKIHDPWTHMSLPKSMVVCDMNITQLNTMQQPVQTWHLYTGMPTEVSGYNTEFTDKKQPQGDLTVGMSFEFWDLDFDNLSLS